MINRPTYRTIITSNLPRSPQPAVIHQQAAFISTGNGDSCLPQNAHFKRFEAKKRLVMLPGLKNSPNVAKRGRNDPKSVKLYRPFDFCLILLAE